MFLSDKERIVELSIRSAAAGVSEHPGRLWLRLNRHSAHPDHGRGELDEAEEVEALRS